MTTLLLFAGTAHAGTGAVLVPPVRIDVGPAVSMHEEGTGAQLVAGIHWASLWPNPATRIDVGIGVVSGSFGSPDEPDAVMPAVTHARGPTDDPLTYHGGYVEVATRPSGTKWWRTWVGARVETGRAEKDGESGSMIGGAVRMSGEVFVPAVGGSGSAFMAGTLAIGVYSELSYRRTEVLGDDVGASIGVSMRIPFIVGR